MSDRDKYGNYVNDKGVTTDKKEVTLILVFMAER